MAFSNGDKFELFPKLPIELRRQIWLHTFRQPYFFTIELEQSTESEQAYYFDRWLRNISQDPTTLFVNRESRAVALATYVKRPRFAVEARLPFKRHLFVNFTIDHFTIYFFPTCLSPADLPNATKSDMARFRYVTMFNTPGWPLEAAIIQWVDCWIRALPTLVEVTFDTDDSNHELDLVNAEDAIASLRSAVVALEKQEKQEREAGRSWEAPRARVILQAQRGFRYEAQLRIKDKPKHTMA